MFLLLVHCIVGIVIREVSQEPDRHRAYQDDSAHLLQILLSLLPCMTEDGLGGRNAVWRKLHHERKVIILEETAHDSCSDDSQYDSQSIKTEHH